MKKIVLIPVALLVLGALIFGYYQLAVSRPNHDGQGLADFTIKSGERVWEIAENLRRARLINSAAAFKIYVRFNRLDNKLQAGYYRIPRDLSLRQVVEILLTGKFDLKLTFPEGWRREEMAYNAAKVLKRPAFYSEFLGETEGLEGYLFPETYIVPQEITVKDLVKTMREIFNKKYSAAATAPGAEKSLSQEEVVNLASIVEREAKKDEDRGVIAGILIKRLRAGWALEADATVQYLIASRKLVGATFENLADFEFWSKAITLDDLKIDSPYNTRRHAGLPPGPIGNPGLASIKAVLNFVETPYWFYLTDRDGQTHFAKTLEEHNRNIERYLRP